MEDDLQQEEDDPLTSDDILCELREEFNNNKLCDSKTNLNLSKAINEVCSKKLTPEKLKIRLKR